MHVRIWRLLRGPCSRRCPRSARHLFLLAAVSPALVRWAEIVGFVEASPRRAASEGASPHGHLLSQYVRLRRRLGRAAAQGLWADLTVVRGQVDADQQADATPLEGNRDVRLALRNQDPVLWVVLARQP